MSKHEKKDVDYSLGMLHSHCGPMFHDDTCSCKHFNSVGNSIAGSCDLVEGVIGARMWCKLYEKAKKK